MWVVCFMLISLLVSYGKATTVTSLSVSYLIITVELFTFLLGFIKDCCSNDKITRVVCFCVEIHGQLCLVLMGSSIVAVRFYRVSLWATCDWRARKHLPCLSKINECLLRLHGLFHLFFSLIGLVCITDS